LNQGLLLYYDIDDLKNINNRFGQDVGDELIKQFSLYLRNIAASFNQVEYQPLLARVNGNEFIIYLHSQSEKGFISNETLLNVLEQPVKVTESTILLKFNIGIARYLNDTKSIDKLLEYAEFALFKVKENPLTHIGFHDIYHYSEEVNKRELMKDLPTIISLKQWYHVYQPILDLETLEFFAYEGLTRPYKSNISQLLELAYETSTYKELERALYISVIQDYAHKKKENCYLTVNEGPHDVFVGHEELLEENRRLIEEQNLKVIIEITEFKKMDTEELLYKINRMKNYNETKVAIDDFGSGYSNELVLLSLNPDIIKIDRGLISGIDGDIRKQILVSNIIRYSGEEIKVIAEGVETKAELRTLMELGINAIQGYYIAKPSVDLVDLSPELKREIMQMKAEINKKV
jgi:diguanylate cyclase (GGDEF)-like protein